MINTDIRTRVNTIEDEQNEIVLERRDVIHGIWVARIAQLHVIMFGAAGCAKTFLGHTKAEHISDSISWEIDLNEYSVPSDMFGVTDIKGMVEQGLNGRVWDGMLPQATDALIDEVMNASASLKHSLHPAMNERVSHNYGKMHDIPLRQIVAATNHNDADTDPSLAPFFDRFHLRYTVGYLQQRENRVSMVTQAIARMSMIGRGTGTRISGAKTTVTLAELDTAHREALSLNVDDDVMDLFDDIWVELKNEGVILSDRRYVDGMAAVLANAWLAGHEDVRREDLDVLQHMWWSLHDHSAEARKIILAATNPSEKAALDLLDELDKLKANLKNAASLDKERQHRVGVEQIRDANKLIKDAHKYLASAQAAGANTTRLVETIKRAEDFKINVGSSIFNVNVDNLASR